MYEVESVVYYTLHSGRLEVYKSTISSFARCFPIDHIHSNDEKALKFTEVKMTGMFYKLTGTFEDYMTRDSVF